MQLYESDGQTHTDLQRAVRLDHSTVSRTVRRMEQAGLVTRCPAEHDKRAMVVSLTDQGRALQPGVIELWSTTETVMTDVSRAISKPASLSSRVVWNRLCALPGMLGADRTPSDADMSIPSCHALPRAPRERSTSEAAGSPRAEDADRYPRPT